MTPRVTWPSFGAGYVLSTLIKRRLLIGAGTLIGVVGAVGALLLITPRYEVSASLLLRLAREVKPAVATGTAGQTFQAVRPEDIASEIEILRSQFLIEKVVQFFGENLFLAEPGPQTFTQRVKAVIRSVAGAVRTAGQEIMIRIGLSRRLTPGEQAVLAVQGGLIVEPVPRSDVIRIRLGTPDPNVGIKVAGKLIDFYLEEHIAAHKTQKARTFLEEQTETTRRALAGHEASRAAFKRSKSVASLDEERKLLLGQRKDMAAALDTTQADASQVAAEIKDIDRKRAELSPDLRLSTTSQRNPLIDILRTRLVTLEGRREELRGKYSDDSRIVSDLDREIEDVRRSLAAEGPYVTQSVTSGVNSTVQTLERELIAKRGTLQGLQARLSTLTQQLAALNAEIRAIELADVELRRLERELVLAEQNYTLYTKNLEEARISEALDIAKISNVVVIAPPTASLVPVWPPKLMVLVGGLLVGLGGAITVAFALEAFRPTVRSRADVAEVLGVPVLASIPDPRAYER